METRARSPDFLKDPTARTLLAGDLEAVSCLLTGCSALRFGIEAWRF